MTNTAPTTLSNEGAAPPVVRTLHPRFIVEGFDFTSGKAKRRLYGCFHRPSGVAERECAILLTPPLGQEYIRCHRALRQLALRLAGLGFPVLRFDPTACGDSSGESEELRLEQLVEDMGAAVKTLRSRSRKIRVCIFGLRIGGTMAALHAAARGDLDGLVLWNPVLNGAAYVSEMNELQAVHERKYATAGAPQSINENPECVEWCGFGYSTDFVRDLTEMPPPAFSKAPAKNILLIDSSADAAMTSMNDLLRQGNTQVTLMNLELQRFWLAEPYEAVVPHAGLQATIDWLKTVYV